MNTLNRVQIWDPWVRLFHWGLVIAFGVAYLTEEEALAIHIAAGYTVLGLVLFRILWGFIGPKHARFSDFVFGPGAIIAYLRDLALLQSRRYLGHNPAGGAMILVLLIALLGTTLSGLAVYAADQHAGLLAFWLAGIGEAWEEQLEEWHEFFANLTVSLVLLHVLGVVAESFLHRENLIKAMVNGYKRG